MKISDLCPYFSQDPQEWVYPRPAHMLPRSLRRALVATFDPRAGAMGAAMDTSPLQAPHRLGVGLRPYAAGDPARALSPRHWVRQRALWVRTDGAPARRRTLALVHCAPSMAFGSPHQPLKGQVAWALAGVLQLLWERWGREVLVVPWRGPLEEAFGALRSRLRGTQELVVVSDFVLTTAQLGALKESLLSGLPPHVVPSALVVRDVEELSSSTSLGHRGASLLPGAFGTGPLQGGRRGSGQGYVEALRDHERELGSLFYRKSFVSAPMVLGPLVQKLTTHGRQRRWS